MSLEVQLLLTQNCNFRCEYCPLTFKNTTLTMKKFLEFYDTKLKACLKAYGEDKYDMIFFGGEPLLEKDLILDIYAKIKNDPLCNRMEIVTNGALLTKELAEKYKNLGIQLSISYDGIWQESNRSTQIPDDSIMKDPVNIRQYVTKTHCMVRPENIDTIAENFEHFVELGLTPDFTLLDDGKWSDDDVERFRVSIDRLLKSNINTIVNKKNPIIAGFFTHWLMNILKPSNIMCSIAGGVTLHPNGNLYPCYRFADKEQFPIWDKGMEEEFGYEGEIDDEMVYHMKEISDMETWKVCRECELFKFCRGGCPHVQMFRLGVDPNLCEMYKILFKKTNELVEKCSQDPIVLLHIEDLMRQT